MDFKGNARCTCGKEMTGCGGSFGGNLSTTWRSCECGIKALFYTISGDKHELKAGLELKDQRKYDEEEREKLLAVFKLAGIPVEKYWNIKNGYGYDKADWLLIQTSKGMIEIGWRKRVISINWSDTGIKHLVGGETTQSESMCHAWSFEDAVKYLRGVWG